MVEDDTHRCLLAELESRSAKGALCPVVETYNADFLKHIPRLHITPPARCLLELALNSRQTQSTPDHAELVI